LLLLIVACGSAAQPAEPQVIEKEVIKEVEVKADPEIIEKEVIREVEKIVEKEVVFATPVAGVYEAEVPEWVSVGADHHCNGVIRFIHRANPGFLDLHYGASSTTVLLPSGPRFNQILAYDPTNPSELMGDLAERWEVSDDGLLLTFHLADAKWQDGEQVTADDMVFSFDRMAQEGVTRGRVTAIRDFLCQRHRSGRG
jgi:ABC-type transport system substrate-binding protein